MNKVILSFIFTGIIAGLPAQGWQPAGDKLNTPWAEKFDTAKPMWNRKLMD